MNHSFSTTLKVMLLLALCIVAAFVLVKEYYFTFLLVVLVISTLTGMLCVDYKKSFGRMEQMIARIRYADLHAAFTKDQAGVEGALYHSMNEAMAAFRKKYTQAIVSEAETEAWQKLIRVMAHEMMNSLTPIISLSETVIERASKGGDVDKEYVILLEAMESIHRRSRGVLEFVENYRKLARIPDPVMQTFPINNLFDGLKKLFSETNVHFAVQPDHLCLHADYAQMEQVLINLITNALESNVDQKEVQVAVKAYQDEENTVIKVTDNGKGIEPEVLDKIFIPFYTNKQGGSGIGLSLSRQIMVRHKGTLSVKSEWEKGAELTMMVPGTVSEM